MGREVLSHLRNLRNSLSNATPEDALSVLREAAEAYRHADLAWKEADEVKVVSREVCGDVLRALGEDTVVVRLGEADGVETVATVTAYYLTRVRATRSLYEFLVSVGLGNLVTVEYRLDQDGLMDAVKKGTVRLEDVRALADVTQTPVTKVTVRTKGGRGDG